MRNANTYAFGKSPPPPFPPTKLTRPETLGYGSKTKFDISARGRERLLRKSIIVYIGSASDFTGLFLLFKPFRSKA